MPTDANFSTVFVDMIMCVMLTYIIGKFILCHVQSCIGELG